MRRRTRCLVSWSTSVGAACTCAARGLAPRRCCCSLALGSSPRTWGGLRRPSPNRPGYACTTGPVAGGATRLTPRRTVPRSLPTCTRCWRARTSPVRTCWPVTPSAACTRWRSRPRTPTRCSGWCCSTPPHPSRRPTPRRRQAPGSYDVMSHLSAMVATSGEVGLSRLYAHVEAGTLAAAVAGRDPRQHREGGHRQEHHRRVRPGEHGDGAGRRS